MKNETTRAYTKGFYLELLMRRNIKLSENEKYLLMKLYNTMTSKQLKKIYMKGEAK